MDFVNSAVINDNIVLYKELKLKHLKTIYKALFGDSPDTNVVFQNFNNILMFLTGWSETEIKKLSLIEYFLLLLEIRCTCIGSIIFAELPDRPNVKIEINLYKFINIIKQIKLSEILKTDTIDNFNIFYKLPSLNELISFNTQTTLEEVYSFFIQKIVFKETIFEIANTDRTIIKKILDRLPAKITSQIIKKTYSIFEEFNKINLLSDILDLNDKKIHFNFNVQNLIGILKLIFGDQLLSVYENIFGLCKAGNFTPEYIENCTPGEYLLFIKKLEEISSKQNQSSDIPVPTETDNNINPFDSPDMPPVTGYSEFTPG